MEFPQETPILMILGSEYSIPSKSPKPQVIANFTFILYSIKMHGTIIDNSLDQLLRKSMVRALTLDFGFSRRRC